MQIRCVICRRVFKGKLGEPSSLCCSTTCFRELQARGQMREDEDRGLQKLFEFGPADVPMTIESAEQLPKLWNTDETDYQKAKAWMAGQSQTSTPTQPEDPGREIAAWADSSMETAKILLDAASRIPDVDVVDDLLALAVDRLARVRALLGGRRSGLLTPDVLSGGDGVGEETAGEEGEG